MATATTIVHTIVCYVEVSYFDTSRISRTKTGLSSYKDCCYSFGRACETMKDAHDFIVSVRRHAAHNANIALISITVDDCGDEENRTVIWEWKASENI